MINDSSKVANHICKFCGKEFYRADSKKKCSKSGLFFCSRECKDLAQRIGGLKEIQPSHYGRVLSDYRLLAKREKPSECCERCGYGKVPGILQVHHKDRNRLNNSIDNLEIICPNCHQEEHFLNNDGIYKRTKIGVACTKAGEEVLQTS